ncbi:MAG: YdcF family protein [Candidatus Omnitrophota bacterium]|nr:YdcF family protein [Candidatus Omnitrophota bacterium]
MRKFFSFFVLALSLSVWGAGYSAGEGKAVGAVLIVLGNEPLDGQTPTLDMVARVKKAAEFFKANPDSVLILTGGPTAGGISEARMMADLALAEGVPEDVLLLEEQARTTSENADLAAGLLRGRDPGRILIVSKADHLEWAVPIFQEKEVFKNAEALACEVDRADSIAQMREYLKGHPENQRVKARLDALVQGVKGTD